MHGAELLLWGMVMLSPSIEKDEEEMCSVRTLAGTIMLFTAVPGAFFCAAQLSPLKRT
jgi:hypothetical protein